MARLLRSLSGVGELRRLRLICDYVDGTLSAAGKAEVERHLAICPACAELAHDSAAAVGFIERAADVEPPPELITRILFDAPWTKPKASPRAGLARLTGWFAPVLRPKLVMGAAMTILSLSMLTRFVAPMRQLRPAIRLARSGPRSTIKPQRGAHREVTRI